MGGLQKYEAKEGEEARGREGGKNRSGKLEGGQREHTRPRCTEK